MLKWMGRAVLTAGILMGAVSVQAQQCNTSMDRLEMRQNLKVLADDLLERWPNAGAAIAESNAHGIAGAVWWWSHKKKSVDGFGPTMALVTGQPPGFVGAHADGDGTWFEGFSPKPLLADNPSFNTPNLLFFERTGNQSSWRQWPLIGFGYPALFEPCEKPIEAIPCFADDDWFIHEAGYHRVLIGDGGMTLAVSLDLCRNPWPGQGIASTGCGKSEYDVSELDPEGCQDIDTEDIERHANRIRHGRFWDLHVWINPDDDKNPRIAIFDPFERWENAPSGRIAMPDVDQAFYYQDTEQCLCGTPQQIDLIAERNGSCTKDAHCENDEYCNAGLDLEPNRCVKLKDDNERCPAVNGGHACKSGKCNLGRCYTPGSVSVGGTCYVDTACQGGKCTAVDGFAGECVCKYDINCSTHEYCDAGLDFKKNQCRGLKADNQTCDLVNGGRTCQSGKCKFGRCYTTDSVAIGGACYVDAACDGGKCSSIDGARGTCVCKNDSDCGTGQYCDAGLDLKLNQCRALKADNQTCELVNGGRTCASGECRFSRCYTPNSVSIGGTCYMDAACDGGKCSSVDGTKGTCVCKSDGDCNSGYWCDKGLDLKKNQCRKKYSKGDICGTVGDIGVGHRCKSGKCKVSGLSAKLKCK